MSKTYVIAVGNLTYFLIAASVMGFFLFRILVSGFELEDKITLVAETNEKVKMQTELSRLIESTQTQRAELSAYVLTEGQTSNFLTGIEQAASAKGVSLTTQSLKVVPEEDAFDSLAIDFIVEGSEESVREMLLLFESLPYHSKVQTLSVAKTDGGMMRGSVGLHVTLAKYD